jgi:hypothetical protein
MDYYFWSGGSIDGTDYNNNGIPTITVNEILEYHNNQNKPKMKPFTLTRSNYLKIYNIACSSWKSQLPTIFPDFNFKDETEVSKEVYDRMYSACTESQKTLFKEIFGNHFNTTPVSSFKTGDWVTCIGDDAKCHLGSSAGWKKDLTFEITKVTEINNHIFILWNGSTGVYEVEGHIKAATENEILNTLYKVGDWITILENRANCAEVKAGDVFKIKEIRDANIVVDGHPYNWCFTRNKFRKATASEIPVQWYPHLTPCLVSVNNAYCLRYSAEKQGHFYVDGNRSGVTNEWNKHFPIDLSNTPLANK